MARYKTPADFLKAHNELRGKLSERPSILATLPADAKPEQVAEYRKAVGLPDIPADASADKIVEAYGIKPPDGYSMTPVEKGLVSEFAKLANQQNMPPAVVKAATDFFFKSNASALQATEKIDADKAKTWQGELRSELGRDFDATISAGEAFLNQRFADNPEMKGELLTARLPGGGLLGDHPAFVKLVTDLAMQNGFTDRIEANSMESSGKSLEQQQLELEGLRMKDPALYNAPATQSKLDKIIGLRLARGEINEMGEPIRQRRFG